jgi:glycerol-3-phosphate dehydrogenase
MSKPSVIIIGAGYTGVATAHDLALRGFDVTVVERGPIASGTSGRTHGLLHSGGRYCVKDQEAAIECIEENVILRRIVPQVFEPDDGLFVALDESDLEYTDTWIAGMEASNIPYKQITPQQALELEPYLNPELKSAYLIPDGTFDPLRLALAFAATAKSNGAKFRLFTEVTELLIDNNRRIMGVKLWDRAADQKSELQADIVVSATGAWAGHIAEMGGAKVPIHPTPGVMVAYDKRFVNRAINRLCEPSDGDIVLPQRRMVVVGTTSFDVEDVDYIPVIEDQIELMLECGSELVPGIRHANMRGAFMAARPLIGAGSTGRSISRTFKCFDHKESDDIDGFVTITGGKATTLRAMAEKTADMVCQKLGVEAECTTENVPLISYRQFYAQ